jgi:cyclopropane fatty-acyl-phospholipid synthase-like methyltransferase
MPDKTKEFRRACNIRYLPASQRLMGYGPGGKNLVGSIGYFIPGEPEVWDQAALEGGERELIFDSPRLSGGGHLLDLGTHTGGSAILMAQGLIHNKLKGHVWTVDNFDDEKRGIAEDRMVEAGVESLITIYQMKSRHAAPKFCGRGIQPFNFIFIDACHDYHAVRDDWRDYHKMVAEGGMVAFHDTNDTNIVRVIEQEVDQKKWELILWINRIKVFRKR